MVYLWQSLDIMQLELEGTIMKEELLKGLTEEQIAKVKACKNSEEMLTVAKEEGIELSEEQLEAVSGGCGTTTPGRAKSCPACGSNNIAVNKFRKANGDIYWFNICKACGHDWHVNFDPEHFDPLGNIFNR